MVTTPPSLSALVECCRKILDGELLASMESDHQGCIAAVKRRIAELDELAASLPTATHSGLCRACENKKLREVLSAPRPDVSLGELDEETLLDAAHILLSCGSPGWERVRKKAAHRIGQRMVAAAEAAALRAQSPAEGGFVLVPREPTPEMVAAGAAGIKAKATFRVQAGGSFNRPLMHTKRGDNKMKAKGAYKAMLAAAPTAIALRESQAEGKGEWIATWNRDHGEPGGTP